MYILGISAFYHDSAAAILLDGEIVAAAQEERFSRRKHDPGFPGNAIDYCLKECSITLGSIDHIVFYDKPLIKFERLLETYIGYTPKGLLSFLAAMPVWIKEKLYLKTVLRKELAALSGLEQKTLPALLFAGHHQSHAASAFYPGPFEEAAILCMDGVGEWATTSVWIGKNNHLDLQWQINFPHSLGLLYSAFTYYCGFKVNSGEYKLMGLAPYGEAKYVDLIKEHLVDIKADGTFRLNMDYFSFATGLRMTNKKFDDLFGVPARPPETELTQFQMDVATSIQVVTEEIVLALAKTIRRETGLKNLCLAGGVALNCVANGKIIREKIFDKIWIQPAAGDAGGAVGAACAAWHEHLGNPRMVTSNRDRMSGSYLGPCYDKSGIVQQLEQFKAIYSVPAEEELYEMLATYLEQGNVVGWFQGRMEFGPRALGGRSIVGDPRNTGMQTTMNLKIKYRESFRPFAPAILAEHANAFFELDEPSPYMLVVAPVQETCRIGNDDQQLFGIERLKQQRSTIPAVTHVDYSARIQTVHADTNPGFHRLLTAFHQRTGCPTLVNTSFNVRGEPIVCTPEDAYRCFMRTEMDYLVLENVFLAKKDQPRWDENENWQETFELD